HGVGLLIRLMPAVASGVVCIARGSPMVASSHAEGTRQPGDPCRSYAGRGEPRRAPPRGAAALVRGAGARAWAGSDEALLLRRGGPRRRAPLSSVGMSDEAPGRMRALENLISKLFGVDAAAMNDGHGMGCPCAKHRAQHKEAEAKIVREGFPAGS